MTKPFKVVSVSRNRNSFGLLGMILLAQDGEIWEVAVNDHNVRRASEVIQADPSGFAQHGFEIPHRLNNVPAELVQTVWDIAQSA